jgi:hypothetical protein
VRVLCCADLVGIPRNVAPCMSSAIHQSKLAMVLKDLGELEEARDLV